MNQDWLSFLKNYTTDFTQPPALLSWIVMLILLLTFTNSLFSILIPQPFLWILYALLLEILLISWLIHRLRIPKNKKNKVGVVVSIFVENEKDQKFLKNDLVLRLRKNFLESDLNDIIHLIIVPNHIAKDIQTKKDIEHRNKKIHGSFWIFGIARTREDKTYLDLEGLVVHSPVAITTSTRLGREFRAALPKRIESLATFSFQLSEFTADQIYFVSRFITGTAAHLSGNPLLALKFHTDLSNLFNTQTTPLLPNQEMMRARLPYLLAEENVLLANYFYTKKNISETEKYLVEAFQHIPHNYNALILRSNMEFTCKTSPSLALSTTIEAQKYSGSDVVWKYNKVFLLLWMGQYQEALAVAKKINRNVNASEMRIIQEIEDFNKNLIEQKIATPVVYFWLGYLNYNQKDNWAEAFSYLEEFERKGTPTMSVLLSLTKVYLTDLRRKMGIN